MVAQSVVRGGKAMLRDVAQFVRNRRIAVAGCGIAVALPSGRARVREANALGQSSNGPKWPV